MGRKKANMLSPLRIGITGGIGSGKTTACKIFEQLGAPIYYADDRAKAIMVEDDEVKSKIIALFGAGAYTSDDLLNRKHIAATAFSDPEKLRALNAIVHPAVFRDAERWQSEQAGAPYTLKEAALLFESGSYKSLDKLIIVSAPIDLRIQRVVERDGLSRQEVEARIRQQMPDEEKLRLSDFVLLNDGTHSLIKQIWNLHRKLLEISGSKAGLH